MTKEQFKKFCEEMTKDDKIPFWLQVKKNQDDFRERVKSGYYNDLKRKPIKTI